MQIIKPWRFYVLYLILGLAAVYVHSRSEAAIPANKPLELFPQKVGQWFMVGQARFDKQVLEKLKPTDYLSRRYQDQEGHQLSLYIGYHNGSLESGPIHSPKQCLPGSGWTRLTDEVREVQVSGKPFHYVSAIYQKEMQKQLFLYWFQVRSDILTNEYELKLAIVKNSILANRHDSAFIRLSLLMNQDEETAIKIGEQFIREFSPAIKASLPK